MGSFSTPLGVHGNVAGLVFKKDGTVAKKPIGLSGKQIRSNPKYIRIRENNQEFAGAVQIATKLRHSLSFNRVTMDKHVVGRLNKHFREILAADTVNERGKRSVLLTDNPGPLLDFQFHAMSPVDTRLRGLYSVAVDSGRTGATLTLPAFNGQADFSFPPGATHVTIGIGVVALSNYHYNPGTKAYTPVEAIANGNYAYAQSAYFANSATAVAAVTLHAALPTGVTLTADDSLIVVLDVKFWQLLNGVYYFFEQGQSMKIALVATA